MTAEFDPVAWCTERFDGTNAPMREVLRALAAEAAKVQARRDAELCREQAPFLRADDSETYARAIEREAGL